MKINTKNITGWSIATKTKNIKAKHLSSLLVDPMIADKFLIDALEGKEALKSNVVICLGPTGDIWQQTPSKLLGKYTIVDIDRNGWMDSKPIPGNAVNCFQVTKEFLGSIKSDAPDGIYNNRKADFFIIGTYGETTVAGSNTQFGEIGDYILQDQKNPDDNWIVKQKIFDNTYSIK